MFEEAVCSFWRHQVKSKWRTFCKTFIAIHSCCNHMVKKGQETGGREREREGMTHSKGATGVEMNPWPLQQGPGLCICGASVKICLAELFKVA